MRKLSIPRLALAITISALILVPPTESFAARKIWLERQLEKLFSEPQRKAPKRRRARPAQARQSDEIRLPDTAPLPEAAPVREAVAPTPPETAVPVPEDKPPPPVEETVAQDDVHPSDRPLENVPAEPPKPEFRPDAPAPATVEPKAAEPAEVPKPEFRPDKPQPEGVEPAEPPPPPPPTDPRSAERPDPSGKLPANEIACRQRLAELGVKFDNRSAASDPSGCSIPYPLVVKSLGKAIELRPDAEMNCAMAEAAAKFAKDVMSPTASKVLGKPLKSISHASAYVCRPRAGTQKLSEHAFGNALDISSFILSDDTTVKVEPNPPEKNGQFVSEVRRAACGPFKTVLGPGDPDHSEHLHFDLAPRRSGATVCE